MQMSFVLKQLFGPVARFQSGSLRGRPSVRSVAKAPRLMPDKDGGTGLKRECSSTANPQLLVGVLLLFCFCFLFLFFSYNDKAVLDIFRHFQSICDTIESLV